MCVVVSDPDSQFSMQSLLRAPCPQPADPADCRSHVRLDAVRTVSDRRCVDDVKRVLIAPDVASVALDVRYLSTQLINSAVAIE